MKFIIASLAVILLFTGCKKDELVETEQFSVEEEAFSSERIAGERCETLPEDVRARLIELSDTSNITNRRQVLYKLETIAEIFIEQGDKRGLFPLIYSYTTAKAVESSERGAYKDQQQADAIIYAFAKRYLKNLYAHLQNRPVEYHWKKYYQLAGNCQQPALRVATCGLNAHLSVDLARSVMDINAGKEFEQDYLTFGAELVNAAPDIINGLKENYGIDATDFFNGLFVGEILDPIYGDGFTTELAFTTIRQEAWSIGQLLRNPRKRAITECAIKIAWLNREKLLDAIRKFGYYDV